MAVKNEVCKEPRREGMGWGHKVREKEGGVLGPARENRHFIMGGRLMNGFLRWDFSLGRVQPVREK